MHVTAYCSSGSQSLPTWLPNHKREPRIGPDPKNPTAFDHPVRRRARVRLSGSVSVWEGYIWKGRREGGKGGDGKIGGSRWNAESNFRRMSFRKFFASARIEKIWTMLATDWN